MTVTFNSQGDVTNGALAGPGALLTYTAAYPKLVLSGTGSSRRYKYRPHNFFRTSGVPATQGVTVIVGHSYIVKVRGGTTSVALTGAGTGTVTDGNPVTWTATTTTLTCTVTGTGGTCEVRHSNSPDTYVATGASAAVFDLPYEYDSAGALIGIVSEFDTTQLLQEGGALDDSGSPWSGNGSFTIVTADNVIDGASAYHHTGGGGGSAARAQGATLATTTQYVLSAVLEEDDALVAHIGLYDNTAAGFVGLASWTWATDAFATDAGTVDSSDFEELSAVGPNGGRLVRIWAAFTTAGNTSHGVYLYPNSTSAVTTATYVHHVQLEPGAVPSSPIESFGASQARAVDDLELAISTTPISATVNSARITYRPRDVSLAVDALKLDDDTANEVIAVGHDASANIGLTVTDGGAAQTAPLTDGTVTADTDETVAVSWQANDFLLSDNGATAVADTGGTLPTVTKLKLGPVHGHIKDVVVVPVEKTAAELALFAA